MLLAIVIYFGSRRVQMHKIAPLSEGMHLLG